MISPEKAIEAIREKIVEIDTIKFYDQFYPWQKATIGTLKRVVPYNSTIIQHLSEIKSLGNISWCAIFKINQSICAVLILKI